MTEINDWQKETTPENDVALANKFGWVAGGFVLIAAMIGVVALQDNNIRLLLIVKLALCAAFLAKILETSFLRRAVIRLTSANRIGGEVYKTEEN